MNDVLISVKDADSTASDAYAYPDTMDSREIHTLFVTLDARVDFSN